MDYDWDDEIQSIVIKNGSSQMMAGYAGDDAPRSVFPTAVGKVKTERRSDEPPFYGRDGFVGDEAQAHRSLLDLECPIEKGIITNWDKMEKIWHHTLYNELVIAPEEHPILLTEPLMNPRCNREKMTEIMFEQFDAPALYIANDPQLVVLASGRRSTGVVIDSGLEKTYCVPMYEGYCVMSKTIRCLDIGGRTLTDYMGKLLKLEKPIPSDILSDLKEKVSEVNGHLKKRECGSKKYELPDGEVITVGEEVRFGCPEPLFQPSLLGMDVPGLREMVSQSIESSDPFLQPDLFGNVVLSGGNTLFPGIRDRLREELTSHSGKRVAVVASPERKYSAWIGGSVWASLSTFVRTAVLKEEYDEFGPSFVHRKCF